MNMPSSDVLLLAVLAAAAAAVIGVLGVVLVARRSTSAAVAIAPVAVVLPVVTGVLASLAQMALSPEQSRLMLAVLAASVPLAILLGVLLARRIRALDRRTSQEQADRIRDQEVEESRRSLRERGVLYEQVEIVARYHWITPIADRLVLLDRDEDHRTLSEKIDSILTHRILGPAIFLGILMTIFQAVFSWATPFMDSIDAGVAWLGTLASTQLPAGLLRSLIVDGAIAGMGGIVVFLPQILLLFFFLGLLEDSGYMARVAFIMDRPMRKVGLSGRSVVPLISGYACAIPGVMATRTMDNQHDRMVTMLVMPLMTCSARLPVYALVISAFVPSGAFLFVGYQAMSLLGLYLMGTGTAILAAYILRRGVLKGEESSFVMELPAYHRPRMRDVLYRMYERAKLFLTRAGTIILAVSILLWALATFPQATPDPLTGEVAAGQQLEQSLMGRAGKSIEPALRPLGFDWKIGVGLISSFAAREVVVSAMGTIYSVADPEEFTGLAAAMKADTYPNGDPVWTPLVAASLLVFFVFACQCMATLAVVKRETASWRWPIFMWVYMFALAYGASLIVYQGGKLLGLE